jgi:hypothetical protein
MLRLHDLDKAQLDAVDYAYENDFTFMIAGMGAGKTIVALTAAEEILMDSGPVKRILVLAPLKVCNKVWRLEHTLWEHTQDLRVQVIAGEEDTGRVLKPSAQIVVVNFELLPWLANNNMFKHFQGLIVDESTKLKAGGVWFKSFRRAVKDFHWRLVMTGTPVSENWSQLFYQMFLVDAGLTFGGNRQKWLDKYFYPTDYKRYKWAVKPLQDERLAAMIEPYVHTMPDYRSTLPPLQVEVIPTPLPPAGREAYAEMAGSMSTQGVTAANAAVKAGKLTQIANGFIYDDDKNTIHLHSAKAEKLEQILKKGGKRVVEKYLIIYQFVAELEMLRHVLPDLAVMDRAGSQVDDWNAGRLGLLAMHPKSAGHGLNMAQGGHNIIWLSAPWSLDLFDQTNARLWRRGQRWPVSVKVLAAPDTIDDLIWARLGDKSKFMPAFLAHLAETARCVAA